MIHNFKKMISMVVVFSFLLLVTLTAYPLHAQTTAPEQQSSIAKDQERPGAVEQTGSAGAAKVSSFPWLIVVAGVVVVGVLLYFLVIAKKNYTLTVTTATGVSGTPAAGATSYSSGTVVNYAYTPQTGYAITVTLDGATVANSGTVTMDKDHTLAATSSYDIRGLWSLTYTWSGYSPGYATITFSGTPTSGTYIATDYYGDSTGTYTVTGNNVSWSYDDSPHATYTGTFGSATAMAGTMTNHSSMTGTWTGTKGAVAVAAQNHLQTASPSAPNAAGQIKQ